MDACVRGRLVFVRRFRVWLCVCHHKMCVQWELPISHAEWHWDGVHFKLGHKQTKKTASSNIDCVRRTDTFMIARMHSAPNTNRHWCMHCSHRPSSMHILFKADARSAAHNPDGGCRHRAIVSRERAHNCALQRAQPQPPGTACTFYQQCHCTVRRVVLRLWRQRPEAAAPVMRWLA